jgi:integration host factor subunit alpha
MLTSLGSFLVRKKGPRVGRNPKTNEVVTISPRRAIVFKASGVLKRRLAEADHQKIATSELATIESDTSE